MRSSRAALLLVIVGLIAAACSNGVPEGAADLPPTPTPTPRPTATMAPTPVPATPTALPSATPIPTPPTATPTPSCGTAESGPLLGAHCLGRDPMPPGLTCVAEDTPFYDATDWNRTRTVVEAAIEAPRHMISTGDLHRLDGADPETGDGVLAVMMSFSIEDGGLGTGLVPVQALEPGHCRALAGPADDLDSLPCLSAPVAVTIGSPDGDAGIIRDIRQHVEPGCTRLVFEAGSSVPFFWQLPPEGIGEVSIRASETQTELTLPIGFESSVEALFLAEARVDDAVIFEDGADGRRRMQILHRPSQMRAQVLDGPTRIVIDLAPLDPSADYEPPIVGRNVIISEPIDPAEDGFVVGETITIRGWLRPRSGHTPFVRVLALRESAAEAYRSSSGPIPFLQVGSALQGNFDGVPDGAWAAFAVEMSTEGWFGASHAILIGDDGPDGFLASGQIVQIAEADGGREENYDLVESQLLIDADPTAWVMQG